MAFYHYPLIALSAGIGRGHPQYLDAVLYHLPDTPCLLASGPGWRLARWIYHLGATGGLITTIYNRTRNRAPGPMEVNLLKFPLTRWFKNYPGIVLVDHPLLAHTLASICRVAYLHAEIGVPAGSAIPDAWCTFVPLNTTARQLQHLGLKPERIIVTGLVIETQLLPVAATAFNSRYQRLSTAQPLTIAFFISGAYPTPHIRQTVIAIRSALNAGHKVVIFPGTGEKKAQKIIAQLPPDIITITASSRREETEKTAELFPQLDIMVAAAHERTNWAVGLGLPMFALLPHIGPFAPLNYEFATRQGVCLPLTEPEKFGATLNRLRKEGKLNQMASAGWEEYPITGARIAADYIVKSVNGK